MHLIKKPPLQKVVKIKSVLYFSNHLKMPNFYPKLGVGSDISKSIFLAMTIIINKGDYDQRR